MTKTAGLDKETLDILLTTLSKLKGRLITPERCRELDKSEDFPAEIVREMLGPEIGLHLVFIPEEYGGLGGGARDIYRVSLELSKIDQAIATAFLAIALGTDPIRVAGTPEQKEKWFSRIAGEGLIVAYGVTEPGAGSNVAALKTRADHVMEGGRLKGYRLNGTKQFITNGGVADLYSILAAAPNGPAFFLVEKGMKGLNPGKPEDKHGIRASNTTPLVLEDLFVPAENLIGGEEGKGLAQASEVFGYTRLMVAAFGIGGGEAALERAVAYAKERIQFGSPLMEKQGYTHKLLVPHAVRLEAAKAYCEEVAARIDQGEKDLNIEGAIAKYFSTEEGNRTAEDSIQALGGYGYIKEYDVERIKRDVRITMIYEGTSEIQQNLISMFRWRTSVKSKGGFYDRMADEMKALENRHPDIGASLAEFGLRMVNRSILFAHEHKLTKQQHVMFLIADMVTLGETAAALCRRAARFLAEKHSRAGLEAAISRIFSREVADGARAMASRVMVGSGKMEAGEFQAFLKEAGSDLLLKGMRGDLADKDMVAERLRDQSGAGEG